ncbi:MAG: 30S ribosomal protein S4 [Nanoarchaeota archaeon]|nr:30S ribosomal protein S4 [Nanoarchaeota archaeon]
MGDPRRLKKKYEKPLQAWNKSKIIKDAELKSKYGYKNKKELWKMESILRTFRKLARNLIARKGEPQSIRESEQILGRLKRIGLLQDGAVLEDILALKVEELMERRIQTVILRKDLAHSIKHARQLIVHGHVLIGEKPITSPSFIIKKEDDNKVVIK